MSTPLSLSVLVGNPLQYLPPIPAGPARSRPAVPFRQHPARPDLLTLSSPARGEAADPALQAALEHSARRWGLERAGIVLLDLQTGRAARRHADRPFPAASVIKLAVMAEVFHQMQQGRLRLDREITIRPENCTDTWMPAEDSRPSLRPGRRVTVGHLVDLMITRSDNIATNTLIDVVGRQELNATMRELGLAGTQFRHKLSGGAIPVRDRDYRGGRNQTTAGDMVRLLELIATEQLVSPEASRQMLAILGRQLDNDKIPARLPRDTRVYHKTGETSRVTHDAAIIESRGRRLVLAVLTELPPRPDTYRRMAGMAAELYQRLQ